MSTLNDKQFRKQADSGEIAVDRHNLLLRIAILYLEDDMDVFRTADNLHSHGWTFGKGHLRSNRTLDVFYCVQLAASLFRATNCYDDDIDDEPYRDNFDDYYAEYHDLLHEEVWKEYYTPSFLAQTPTARFYRLPNLRDATDTSDPMRGVRREGIGHFTKLPRWAYTVKKTWFRQPNIPNAAMRDLAVSTLRETTSRQRKDFLDVQPYSETQAQFWLNKMGMNTINPQVNEETYRLYYLFGTLVATGWYDVRLWEKYYSRERWESAEAQDRFLEEDLDGMRKSEVNWCGFPDGGLMGEVSLMGFEEELGSEEEIVFLAAVAAKEILALQVDEVETAGAEETEKVDGMIGLNYAIRSHILLGVLRAAFETDQALHMDDLKKRVVASGRLDDQSVGLWMETALGIIKPYAKDRARPTDVRGWSELLRLLLEENGQLFGRWKLMGSDEKWRQTYLGYGEKDKNPYKLGPRKDLLRE